MKSMVAVLSAGLMSGAMVGAAVADDDVKVVRGFAFVSSDEANDVTAVVAADGEAAPDEVAAEDATATVVISTDDVATVSGDEDGKSYSIRVESSTSSTDESDDDAKPKVTRMARIVVVGPDGKEKVYNVNGDAAQALQLNLNGGEDAADAIKLLQSFNMLKEDSSESEQGDDPAEVAEEERFMIGVRCEGVSEQLRRHLKLGDQGLIIVEVRGETPAHEAGLAIDDIIVAINDKVLSSQDDLVSSVTDSKGEQLGLTVIRDGEKQTITVVPKKMKVPVVVAPAAFEGFDISGLKELEALQDVEGMDPVVLEKLKLDIQELLSSGKAGIKVRRLHPGVIIAEGAPTDEAGVNLLIERLRKEAGDKAAKAVAEAHEAASHAHAARDAHAVAEAQTERLHDTLMQMQKQMEAMRQQMEAMQRQLEHAKDQDK